MLFSFLKRKPKINIYTVAFYNLENLFDTVHDEGKLDTDFTPKGFKKWSMKRYKRKVYKLAKTISEIGKTNSTTPPVLVGVAEVENDRVIEDLLDAEPLRKIDYGYVHYESPDERGIDTALLYHKKYFEVQYSEPITLYVNNPDGERDTTRDILYVRGKLNGEEVHVFVNHWPSRRDGEMVTDYKRLKAAHTILEFMTKLETTYTNANYLVLGDFNDDPKSESILALVDGMGLYNPMDKLHIPVQRGSANYNESWSLFDQIMVSHSFLNHEKGTHSFAHANIFDENFLVEYKGKYKGSPYRTYAGRKYIGGYSDHFPVYIQLKYNG